MDLGVGRGRTDDGLELRAAVARDRQRLSGDSLSPSAPGPGFTASRGCAGWVRQSSQQAVGVASGLGAAVASRTQSGVKSCRAALSALAEATRQSSVRLHPEVGENAERGAARLAAEQEGSPASDRLPLVDQGREDHIISSVKEYEFLDPFFAALDVLFHALDQSYRCLDRFCCEVCFQNRIQWFCFG